MADPVYPFRLPESSNGRPILTELRVHGVSGPDPATVLEYPQVFQVAGDSLTGFARRLAAGGYGPVDAVDSEDPCRRLEAFSWRGVSSGTASRAVWLLLVPFALLNLGYWMHPNPVGGESPADDRHRAALVAKPWSADWVALLHALYRALALLFTSFFVLATVGLTQDML
jgi:hypothetical protein